MLVQKVNGRRSRGPERVSQRKSACQADNIKCWQTPGNACRQEQCVEFQTNCTSHQRKSLEIKTTVQCAVTDNNANSVRNNKDAERKQECISTFFMYH